MTSMYALQDTVFPMSHEFMAYHLQPSTFNLSPKAYHLQPTTSNYHLQPTNGRVGPVSCITFLQFKF